MTRAERDQARQAVQCENATERLYNTRMSLCVCFARPEMGLLYEAIHAKPSLEPSLLHACYLATPIDDPYGL